MLVGMETLLEYFLRITPALALITLVFFLLPRKQLLARIFILIVGFILMRDAMTPEGIWSFGLTTPAIWLRFVENSTVLFILGALSGLTAWTLLRSRDLRRLVRWGNVRSWRPYVVGVLAGVLVVAPFVALSVGTPLEARGGAVAVSLLPALFVMAILGNLLEEVIFRGFLQSYFEKHMTGVRAAVLSGLMFAVAHIFLATTVTDLGWPLLAFVLLEGLVCAFIYRKYGLIGAALTHGVAIFILAAGIL